MSGTFDRHFDGQNGCAFPILPVKVSVNIGIILNFEGDFEGHGKATVI